MMYGPPPEYPRATSSPTIILLVSGLAALLGFLLGVFVGFGAGTIPEEPTPAVTVTVEDTQPADPEPTGTAPSTGLPQSTPPPTGSTTAPPTGPSTGPSTGSSTGVPQNTPPPGGVTSTGPAINPASLRTMLVGTDIQPGTYRTAGPTPGFSMCFWARMRGTTGDVIATGMPTGAATVTIQATDKAFQTGGCAEWTKA
ncbi:hypothetical protein [Nonomuraea rosea]